MTEKLGADADAGFPEGQSADEETAAKKVRERALRLLTIADRTRWELTQRLEGDGPPHVIEAVLTWLEGLGYLDDERFALRWIEARKGRYGPLRLEAELRAKGLQGEWVRSLIDEHVGDEAALEEAAYRLIQSRIPAPVPRAEGLASDDGEIAAEAAEPDPRLYRRLTAFLQRRGYPAGVASRVVTRALRPFC